MSNLRTRYGVVHRFDDTPREIDGEVVLRAACGITSTTERVVDQPLPFIADEMAKRPLSDWPMSRDYCCEQRDADVAWLRGKDESEATFWCFTHKKYHALADGTCPERGES